MRRFSAIVPYVAANSQSWRTRIEGGASPAPPKIRPGAAQPKADMEPPYHVILFDDDEHTYAYVIEMICEIFGHSLEKAFRMAEEVDAMGRVIVITCHKELAELRKEQIEEFGADPRIPKCKGSMSASIEPAA